MKNNPPSWERGIYNVSVLFGCGVSSKREVGMVSSESFNSTFSPLIAEALRKYPLLKSRSEVVPCHLELQELKQFVLE